MTKSTNTLLPILAKNIGVNSSFQLLWSPFHFKNLNRFRILAGNSNEESIVICTQPPKIINFNHFAARPFLNYNLQKITDFEKVMQILII